MQDPVFSYLDEAFLQSLGYTVLFTPDAFSKITSSTFLFAPHLEWPSYVQALQAATPGLCIGNDVREYLDTLQMSVVEEPSKMKQPLQDFLSKSESCMMPEFDIETWCTSTSIYWRKEEDEAEEVNYSEFEKRLDGVKLEKAGRDFRNETP